MIKNMFVILKMVKKTDYVLRKYMMHKIQNKILKKQEIIKITRNKEYFVKQVNFLLKLNIIKEVLKNLRNPLQNIKMMSIYVKIIVNLQMMIINKMKKKQKILNNRNMKDVKKNQKTIIVKRKM